MKPFLPLLAAVVIFICSLFSGYSFSVMPSPKKKNLQLSHDESLVAAKSYQKQRVVVHLDAEKTNACPWDLPTIPCVLCFQK